MPEKELIVETVWPRVRALLVAVLQKEGDAARSLLMPGESADSLFDLFGLMPLEILLKTVLERPRVGLSRIIPMPDHADRLLIEYLWLEQDQSSVADPLAHGGAVTVQMQQHAGEWQLATITPDNHPHTLTAAAARATLTRLRHENGGSLPHSPTVLPPAFVAGELTLPFRRGAMRDAVEHALFPALQQAGHGPDALLLARALWRRCVAGLPDLDPQNGPLYAAAVEVALADHLATPRTQATIAAAYGVPLARLFGAVRQLRQG